MATIATVLARARDILKFRIERMLLRGTGVRLLLVALLIGTVSVIAGILVILIDGDFDQPGRAIWWAFLRLTDPGYLGDDQGIGRRIVSTVLTVAGYVLFMGALVAILTQWLNQTIRDLESGHTSIVQKDHVLVLGWTTRTATIVAEMLTLEERVRRFLALHEARDINLVVLLEEVSAERRHDLRESVGAAWREEHVVMRSGSPLRIEHLQRVDYLRASAILLPAEDLDESEAASDTRTIKTLASMSKHSKDAQLPLVVTEVFDARKINIARRAYRGPVEVVASDQLVCRLLALTILHPGMSHVLSELLVRGEGNEVHVHEPGDLVGGTVSEVRHHFPHGIFLGLVRSGDGVHQSQLCPADDVTIERNHALVVLARSHADAAPGGHDDCSDIDDSARERDVTQKPEHVLVLGWSDRVPDLIAELAAHGRGLTIDVLSDVPSNERQLVLDEHDLRGAIVNHIEGDIVSPMVIARQDVAHYDAAVFMASDRVSTGAQSDARTILTYLLVREALEGASDTPRFVVELMDGHNQPLIEAIDVEVVVSPLVVGRVLAHVALRPELRAVYDELFAAGRAGLAIKRAKVYGVEREALRFDEWRVRLAAHGDLLLGMLDDHGVRLNPDHKRAIDVGPEQRFVVIEIGEGG